MELTFARSVEEMIDLVKDLEWMGYGVKYVISNVNEEVKLLQRNSLFYFSQHFYFSTKQTISDQTFVLTLLPQTSYTIYVFHFF